jgi:hypothetical protein
MTVHSGKRGRVNGVNTMRRWSIVETERQPKAVASNTLIGTARRRGVRSWSGSYEAYGEQPVTGAMPGETFALSAYGAPADDISGSGLLYEGDCVVKQVRIKWDWKAGAIISHTVDFDGHLELEKNSGADPGDAVTPNLKETAGTKLLWAANTGTPATELPNLTSMELTITAAVADYVNSSTYINSVLWTGRKAGPIDWTLKISQEDDERLTGIFTVGDYVNLRLMTDGTNYWELTTGLVSGFSGITVNRESGEIIGRSIDIGMNAYYGSSAGHVILPGGTTWWPF